MTTRTWLRWGSGLGILALIVMAFVTRMGQASVPSSREKLPEVPRIAESRKLKDYVRKGLFSGGDRAIQDVIVREIRGSKNSEYERLVIDLEGTLNGESAGIARAPYFQVNVDPEKNRIEVSIWGAPKLHFDPKKVSPIFKGHSVFGQVDLLPKLDGDHWTFTVSLRPKSVVEVFELSNPVRIIVDAKSDPRQVTPL